MVNIKISAEASNYIHSKKPGRANIVIYRDIPIGSCTRCSGSMTMHFIPSLKVTNKEPDAQYFVPHSDGDSRYSDIVIWVENALLPELNESEVNISLRKGLLMKRLKLVLKPKDIFEELK